MTHGCLLIRRIEERRTLLLHTYHTGMDIPNAVLMAPAFHAVNRFRWMTEEWYKSMRRVRKSLEEELSSFSAGEEMGWPPTVASWIVAVKPNFLEPVPPSFVRSLPMWSGVDDPFRLVVDDEGWTLTDKEGVSTRIEVRDLIVDAVAEMVRRGRRHNKR